ncbi:MAG TPA: endonuclease/exonuclease/phosphatase family protein [Candidatus Limnocylindrales bacterium]
MRLASYNIRRGGTGRASSIAAVLRAIDPDVVVLQEATDANVVSALAQALDATVALAWPGRSVAVLSRIDASEARWHHPGIGNSVAEVSFEEPDVRLIGVHLAAGLSGRRERRRDREVEQLLAAVNEPPGPARTIIAGDLNAIAPGESPTVAVLPPRVRIMLRIGGWIETTVIARLVDDGLADAYRMLHPDEPGLTMPAKAPSVRLDYAFLGFGLVGAAVGCEVGGADQALMIAASDHLPLVLELDVSGGPAVAASG